MWKNLKIFLQYIGSLFSSYTDSEEKKIGKFFRKFSSKNFSATDRIFLENSMQDNPARLHLYLEKKYKGYKGLSTWERKKLYKNFEKIFSRLEIFCEINGKKLEGSFGKVMKSRRSRIISPPGSPPEISGMTGLGEDKEKLFFLFCITQYLELGKILKYKESSAFSKILQDPNSPQKNFLVGDCNQIVTLYICLYAKKFPVTDLQLKIFEKHICLHFQGIDIETTTGKFCQYDEFLFLTSVYENISVNLLDISDREMMQEKISPYSLLEASKLAFAFSSHRNIVQRNFKIAQKNMALFFLKSKKFTKAILWAKKIPDFDLVKNISKEEEVSKFSALLKEIQKISSRKILLQKKSKLKKLLYLSKKLKQKKVEKFCRDIL